MGVIARDCRSWHANCRRLAISSFSFLFLGERNVGDAAKLKICIDREQCIGDGLCVNEAPETFELDDDQKAVVLDGPGNDLEYILAAAKSCPLDIIVVEDNATGKKLYP